VSDSAGEKEEEQGTHGFRVEESGEGATANWLGGGKTGP
jgi:hypothetical protein